MQSWNNSGIFAVPQVPAFCELASQGRSTMTGLGFKKLNPENFLDVDPQTQSFANRSDPLSGGTREMSRDEFLSYIFAPQLTAAVPEDVRSALEGARGAMCYGYFFYPLFMVGVEQSFRTAEAAARLRAGQLNGPRTARFVELIEFLLNAGAIAQADRDQWDAIRRLRNEAAHPKFQQLVPPGPCVEMLTTVCHAINRLFAQPQREIPDDPSGYRESK
jgi:hypothetical protein